MTKNDEVLSVIDELLERLDTIFLELTKAGKQFFNETKFDEASQIIAQIKAVSAFQAKIISLREEWWRINSSLELNENEQNTIPHSEQTKTLEPGLRTPNQAFHLPILSALIHLGGSGSVQSVLDHVHKIMVDQLNIYDYQSLPSNPNAVRWENNAQWARLKLVNDGFLASDSPRGVWEITEKGRIRVSEARPEIGTAESRSEYHTEPFDFNDKNEENL